MKIILPVILSLLFTATLRAAAISGDIQLKFSESFGGADGFRKEFGDVIKATCNWSAGDFFGQETVFATVSLKNTGSKAMFYNYYVAFFDKDNNLVGAAGQGSFGDAGLKPGGDVQLGSCLIHLPKDKYKEITSYKAVLYETDIPPKK